MALQLEALLTIHLLWRVRNGPKEGKQLCLGDSDDSSNHIVVTDTLLVLRCCRWQQRHFTRGSFRFIRKSNPSCLGELCESQWLPMRPLTDTEPQSPLLWGQRRPAQVPGHRLISAPSSSRTCALVVGAISCFDTWAYLDIEMHGLA